MLAGTMQRYYTSIRDPNGYGTGPVGPNAVMCY